MLHLLALNGQDLRIRPLRERKDALRPAHHGRRPPSSFSDDFSDPIKLLAVAEKMELEGIVSKLADRPYVSGRNAGWVKVMWRIATASRGESLRKVS